MIYIISILFVIYVILHPPVRKVRIKTVNSEIEKYYNVAKIPFSGIPFIKIVNDIYPNEEVYYGLLINNKLIEGRHESSGKSICFTYEIE